MNYTAIFRNHALNRPSHPAIIDSTGAIAYRELDGLITQAAQRFLAAGIARGNFVAVMLPNTAEHVIAICGLLRMGAVILSLEPASPPDEVNLKLAQFGIKWLLAPNAIYPAVGATVLAVDPTWRQSRPVTGAASVFPDDGAMAAFLVLSSGTTGKPKAIVHTHEMMRLRVPLSQMNMGYGPHDRYGAIIPISFNVGRIHCLQTLQTGGTAVLFPDVQSAGMAIDLINRSKVTWTFLIPKHLRQMIQLASRGRQPALPYLRQLVVSSAVLYAEEREATRRVLTPNLFEQYGSNECGLHSVSSPFEQTLQPDSVGHVIVGVEGQIVDDDDRPLPAGSVGQIRFRGPGYPAGYYNDPEASALSFRNDWFYPGDMAVIDADGFVFLKGRVDDTINVDGINVSPAEIEAVLMSHPAVAEAAAVGHLGELKQELPVAFVVLKDSATADELLRYCQPRLARSKQPQRIYLVESLPKNETGKVLRRKLRDPGAA